MSCIVQIDLYFIHVYWSLRGGVLCFNHDNAFYQLSIYTALKPNADGGHSLIHKEEEFDVNSRFER